MKCLRCNCKNRQCESEEKNFSCRFIDLKDKETRLLITGLWLAGIETWCPDENKEKDYGIYPCIELKINKPTTDKEVLSKINNIINSYHRVRSLIKWKVEEGGDGAFYLTPKDKNHSITVKHKAIEEFGLYLHYVVAR